MLKAALALVFLAAGAGAVVDERALYPEGPLWRDGRLYVTEMGRDQVSVYEGGRKRAFWRARGCGPTSIAPYNEGFLILCHIGARLVAVDAEGRTLREIRTDAAGGVFLDPNDSSADGAGGVFLSDPGLFAREAPVQGAIVYLAPDGAAHRVAQGLRYPNGVFVDSAEHALYVSEHLAQRVLRYPILPGGALGQMEVFARIDFSAPPFRGRGEAYPERGPDGLERGPDGLLYVAIYGEGVVLALDAEGEVRGWIATPTRYVTNVAFAENGDAIVTGARDNVRPPYRGEVRRFPPLQSRER